MISSVLRPLESGKEADVFVVECDGKVCVAKVYRARKLRSFKNDAGYREGRAVRGSRAQRALTKGTRFGERIAEQAWHSAEADALRRLQAAGARVPRVIAHHDPILIMEAVLDRRGELAPHLGQVPLSPEGAEAMYEQLIEQVILMLQNDLIHGDLSPYNVLVGAKGPVIIDFPQCVSAPHNQQAAHLLERDIHAIARHLGLIEPGLAHLGRQAWQIWVEYERGTLSTTFRPDPTLERPTLVGDLADLADFVQATKRDADLERRAAEGDEDARALLRAAERREVRAQRAAAERAAAQEEAEKAARREASRKAAAKAGAAASGSSKRRKRRGGMRGAQGQPQGQPPDRQTKGQPGGRPSRTSGRATQPQATDQRSSNRNRPRRGRRR